MSEMVSLPFGAGSWRSPPIVRRRDRHRIGGYSHSMAGTGALTGAATDDAKFSPARRPELGDQPGESHPLLHRRYPEGLDRPMIRRASSTTLHTMTLFGYFSVRRATMTR